MKSLRLMWASILQFIDLIMIGQYNSGVEVYNP